MAERRRLVDREATRERCRANNSRNGAIFLRLPKGVRLWRPMKKIMASFDILPYRVSLEKNLDNIPVGDIWYRLHYKIHSWIGPNGMSFICPTSKGEPCPICERVMKLKENYDKNEKRIGALKAKDQVAYNIVFEGEEEIKVFDYSSFKFSDDFEKELDEGDPANYGFYDLVDGRTIKARFIEDTYENKPYIRADRFDFLERQQDLHEDFLKASVPLDKCMNVLSYEQIMEIAFGKGASEESGDGEDDSENDSSSRKQRRPSRENDDDFADDPQPKKPSSKRPAPPPEDEGQENDGENWGTELGEDDFNDNPPKKSSSKRPAPPPEDEGQENEPPPKKPSSKRPAPRNDDGEGEEVNDNPPPKKPSRRPPEDEGQEDNPPPRRAPKKPSREEDGFNDDPPPKKPSSKRPAPREEEGQEDDPPPKKSSSKRPAPPPEDNEPEGEGNGEGDDWGNWEEGNEGNGN